MKKNEYLVAKISFDTAENEPFKLKRLLIPAAFNPPLMGRKYRSAHPPFSHQTIPQCSPLAVTFRSTQQLLRSSYSASLLR